MAVVSLLGLSLLGACASRGEQAASAGFGPRVADAMLRAGDSQAALGVADGLLSTNPEDVEARLRRGRALLALGRPGDAAEDFATAARQRPRDVSVLAALAGARAASGDAALAERAWRDVLKRRPADRQARIGLGIALDLQERHADAQALYRAVLHDRPDDMTAKIDLGLSLALSGQAGAALPYLESAPSGGAGARARHDLAVALLLAGQEGRAREVLSADMDAASIAEVIDGVRALDRI